MISVFVVDGPLGGQNFALDTSRWETESTLALRTSDDRRAIYRCRYAPNHWKARFNERGERENDPAGWQVEAYPWEGVLFFVGYDIGELA